MPEPNLRALVEGASERIVRFAQALVRAPSLTGQEGKAAMLVQQELERLGYDEVSVDEAGNVIGCLRGGPGRRVLLHAHVDVVDPGDPSLWRHHPFSGAIEEGCLWGRGAVDDKGSVAAQVYALGLLREAGITPPGDLLLAAVVGEEVGGLGTRYLSRTLRPDVAIIGEPSHNTLRRGHRGRFEFIVTFRGRSAHASVPHEGRNPHYAMARFLLALREAPMAHDAEFGDTTVAPTLISVDQHNSNVIPAEVRVHLDWRSAPHETPSQAQAFLEELVRSCLEPDITGQVAIRTQSVSSYTGYQETVRHAVTPFVTVPNDPLLACAHRALEKAFGRPVPIEIWPFFTDGGFLHAQGVPCLGFGPGQETMAHVADERLPLDQLLEATLGYMALALALSGMPKDTE
ncbi:MAG: ArgE/DapE family deacylase [Chloroflexi bacterium]|nr:ArgE/DapE family deacylase [Chloroflexota bacterium]